MTDLVTSKQAMSSLEIAEVTGKQHAHIMRDIKNLLNQGVSQSNFGLAEYSDSQGKPRPCYNLTPKGVLILASGYNPLLREKIINRLEELEEQRRRDEQIQAASEPSELALTNTFEISTLTGRPHDRIMKDIRKILEQGAGEDDFIPIFRPVQTESGLKEYETYDITPKGLLTLATGYPPLLRDRIAARFVEVTGLGNTGTGIRPAPEPVRENSPEKEKVPGNGTDRPKERAETQQEIDFLKERIRRMEKQLRRLSTLPETPNEDIFRQFPQYHSVSVPMPTPDDLYNSMTFDNVRKKLYCDLGIEFSPISLSKYLEAHGFVTNEGKDRLKPTKNAVDDNWILYPVEIPDEEGGIRLWRPKFTERGYMILVSRIRDYGVFEY